MRARGGTTAAAPRFTLVFTETDGPMPSCRLTAKDTDSRCAFGAGVISHIQDRAYL